MVHAPAKLNLFFEVLARRPDGFHEIETLMVPIGLFDTLSHASEPTGSCSSIAAGPLASPKRTLGTLPDPENNSGLTRCALLRERAGVDRGLSLELVKRIPSRGRLGRWIERRRRGAVGGQSKSGNSAGRARRWPNWPRSWAATCRSSSAAAQRFAADAASGSSLLATCCRCTSSSCARRSGFRPRPSMASAEVPQQPQSREPLVAALRAATRENLMQSGS